MFLGCGLFVLESCLVIGGDVLANFCLDGLSLD